MTAVQMSIVMHAKYANKYENNEKQAVKNGFMELGITIQEEGFARIVHSYSLLNTGTKPIHFLVIGVVL